MIDVRPDFSKFVNVRDLLRNHAESTPDRIFLRSIDQTTAVSWSALYRFSNRLAAFLTSKDIGANDRVAILADNSLENLMLFFAVLRHGATLCTLSTDSGAGPLCEMLTRLRPKLVLWSGEAARALVTTGVPGEWLEFGDRGEKGGFFDMIESWPDTPVLPSVGGHDDFAIISFTSGTSAAPKGVLQQYGNFFWNTEQVTRTFQLTASDRLLEYRSLNWASTQYLSLMPCLMAGAEILFASRFSQSRFFDWIRTYRPTVAIGIPTVVNMLLARRNAAGASEFDSMRFMTCSTAPLMVEQHKRFEETYGISLVQLYGMSEAGTIACNNPGATRVGSVGKPLGYQNVVVLDDSGRPLPAGQIGAIETGGAQNAYGYLFEDGSIEKIRDSMLKTGDLGYLDADGFLYITGRAKDVIIRGGVNISPTEIDNVLTAHPDIIEAATIGVADAVYGEEVVSYVVVAPGRSLDAAAVRAHCAASLPDFKRPKRIVFADTLPKTQRAKIDRAALAEDWKRQNANALPA
jgi:acyl-CoA synthetase (AMP-forming)/AMP-acid ligase II